MFATNLALNGYTRISQNGINKLSVNFTNDVQIIIGSNGSGKSSIKEQISPLVPETADFTKGGSKKYCATHQGSSYVLINDYGDHAGHYFEKDGVVLNDYGTALVQKALIQQHFGLNQNVFNVLIDNDKFTDMSPIQRRDWIMSLSGIDIEPLMQRFQKAKDKLRDAKGYMVKVAERLKIEERNKIDDAYVKEKQEQLQQLKDEFNYYSQFSTELTPINKKGNLSQFYRTMEDFILNIHDSVPKVPSWLLVCGVKSRSDLPKFIQEYTFKLNSVNEQLESSMKDLQEINKVAQAKALLSNQGIDEITNVINQIQNQIDKLDAQLAEYDYSVVEARKAKVDFLRIFAELKTSVFELPDNKDMRFNSIELNKARAMEEAYFSRLTKLKEGIFKREHGVKPIDDSDDINCPQCKYVFKVGVGTYDKADLLKEIANLSAEKVEVEKLIATNAEFIKECSAYIEQIKNIYNVMKLTPSNDGLWHKVRNYEVFKNSSFPVIDMLDNHLGYLELAVEKEISVELLAKENDILLKAQESLNIIKESSDASVASIDDKVFNLSATRDQLKKELDYVKLLDARFTNIDNNVTKLTAMYDDFSIIYFNELDTMRANFIRDTKYDIMKEINFIEQELEQALVRNSIYQDVENQLREAKQEHYEWGVIVTELSPNTGLIARAMSDAIEIFIDNLTNVINSVWTSDFKILPCLNKKNDLDWKFPVEVTNGIRRSDVSKTSTSQKDIINFSFKLVVLKNLGAADYPLFIDELGSSMDDQHRINLMRVIAELVETKQCSQLFLISHFSAFHEQFDNTEVFVVNSQNILDMPRVYNKHVRIN